MILGLFLLISILGLGLFLFTYEKRSSEEQSGGVSGKAFRQQYYCIDLSDTELNEVKKIDRESKIDNLNINSVRTKLETSPIDEEGYINFYNRKNETMQLWHTGEDKWGVSYIPIPGIDMYEIETSFEDAFGLLKRFAKEEVLRSSIKSKYDYRVHDLSNGFNKEWVKKYNLTVEDVLNKNDSYSFGSYSTKAKILRDGFGYSKEEARETIEKNYNFNEQDVLNRADLGNPDAYSATIDLLKNLYDYDLASAQLAAEWKMRNMLAELFNSKSVEEICLYNYEAVDKIESIPFIPDKAKKWLLQDLHGYTESEARDFVQTYEQETRNIKLNKDKRKIKQKIKELQGDIPSDSREPIPEDVQNQVWNRDGGKCVKCGSKEKLEFDHIIPFSKGGANTARNLQLLCEKCNRSKSNNIG